MLICLGEQQYPLVYSRIDFYDTIADTIELELDWTCPVIIFKGSGQKYKEFFSGLPLLEYFKHCSSIVLGGFRGVLKRRNVYLLHP